MAEQPFQSTSSRYKFSRIGTDGAGNLFLVDREPFRFREREDNIRHTTREGERWWHIAQRFYRDISDNAGLLYWIICDYQVPPVLDPTLQPGAGTTVILPSPTVVLGEIFSFEVEVFQ